MGYYATVSGSFDFKESVGSVLEQIQKEHPEYPKYSSLEKLIDEEFNIDAEINSFSNPPDNIGFYSEAKYNDENYCALLKLLAPYIKQPAALQFRGEDDDLWKLKVENNEVYEFYGEIHYEDNDKITEEEIMKFLDERELNECMDSDEDMQKLKKDKLKELVKEVEETEKYWSKENLKKLLLAISFVNYAYKCEFDNSKGTNLPDLSFDNACDYLQSVIFSQDVN